MLGIGTLELAAEAGAAAAPENRLPILALLDARRGEVYAQRFAADLAPLTEPALAPLASATADLAIALPARRRRRGEHARPDGA